MNQPIVLPPMCIDTNTIPKWLTRLPTTLLPLQEHYRVVEQYVQDHLAGTLSFPIADAYEKWIPLATITAGYLFPLEDVDNQLGVRYFLSDPLKIIKAFGGKWPEGPLIESLAYVQKTHPERTDLPPILQNIFASLETLRADRSVEAYYQRIIATQASLGEYVQTDTGRDELATLFWLNKSSHLSYIKARIGQEENESFRRELLLQFTPEDFTLSAKRELKEETGRWPTMPLLPYLVLPEVKKINAVRYSVTKLRMYHMTGVLSNPVCQQKNSQSELDQELQGRISPSLVDMIELQYSYLELKLWVGEWQGESRKQSTKLSTAWANFYAWLVAKVLLDKKVITEQVIRHSTV